MLVRYVLVVGLLLHAHYSILYEKRDASSESIFPIRSSGMEVVYSVCDILPVCCTYRSLCTALNVCASYTLCTGLCAQDTHVSFVTGAVYVQ